MKMKNKLKFALAPAITLVLFCIILAAKGIYPFGQRTIDYYDMAQQFAPFYYHLYDALHGTKGLFFDWYTALGINMASVSNCSNLSPFNLFFLFIRREHLLPSLSVFTMIKLVCMSASMYFYLTKTDLKAPESFRVAAAVSYSFCGFVLLNYTINPWLDVAALFPVLMYFHDRVIRDGKIAGYAITLALTFIISYYQGAMVLVFLFLYTGLLIVRDRIFDKDSGARCRIFELGIATVIGIALSSFIFVPQIAQMTGSARFQNGSSADGLFATYAEILSHIKGDYSTRWWTLLGVSFATSVIITGIIRCRKDRRMLFTSISMLVLVLAELFVESTNLLMHFGSYVHYPIRNGYIICFVFGYLMCEYAARLFGEDSSYGKKSYIALAALPVTIAGFMLFSGWLAGNKGLPYRNVLHVTAFIMAGTLVYYLVILNLPFIKGLRIPKGIYSLSWGILACELLCFGYMMLGQPDFVLGYTEAPEQSNDFIYTCDRLRDELGLEPERIHRVKNPDESLNANYGFVLAQPALSSWTAMLDPAEQQGAAKWGYSYQYTRLLDAGGTAFSDALIGIDKVISCLDMDDELYEPVKSTDAGYTLYKPKYTLPFGIMMVDDPSVSWEEGDAVSLHNKVYDAIMAGSVSSDPGDDKLASWLVKGAIDEQIDVHVDGRMALYLYGAGGDNDDRRLTIETARNGSSGSEVVPVPDIGDPGNTGYPAYFNNNAVYLGSFEDEDVSICVTCDVQKGERFAVDVMGLDLDKLESVCSVCSGVSGEDIAAGKTSLKCRVDNSNGLANALLLPVAFGRGWTVSVNGEKTQAYARTGLFTVIPLVSGVNDIEMRFTPPGMVLGCCISLAAAIALGIYLFAGRRRSLLLPAECGTYYICDPGSISDLRCCREADIFMIFSHQCMLYI